ncbi:MAG: outer membrane protein assembly factor BamD [Terriglobales bacterium]
MPLKFPRRLGSALGPASIFTLLLAMGSAGCLMRPTKVSNPLAAVKSAQPDKVLFDTSMQDMAKGKYTVARLSLETLLNTYPDSEYLARAKMAIADSWYKEGGVEGMAQAEAQYKDFITFFPAMKEASEAQLKIATIHFNQLQKPDRDPTQADAAQAALRTFLISYPDSPLRPQAEQMLRSTQEVIAEGGYRIAAFYLERARQGDYTDYRAAQSRLEEVLADYPLYSRGDEALDELAHSYVTTSHLYTGATKVESNKDTRSLYAANEKSDQAKAAADFASLIERYPESPYVKDAAAQLAALHVPVPKPTAEAIAFNKREIAGRVGADKKAGFLSWSRVDSVWSGRPSDEIARADKVGNPSLQQPPPLAEDPSPGLDALLQTTMVATGAIPAGQAKQLLAVNAPPAPASGTPAATATGTATVAPAAGKPLAFQDVTTAKARGADTPETNTPQASTGSNDNDPNAVQASVLNDPQLLLTPNEVDLENREQMLAAEVHRDVPAPFAELEKAAKKQNAARRELITKMENAARQKRGGASPNPNASASAATAAAGVTAPPDGTPPLPTQKKKSWWHIW